MPCGVGPLAPRLAQLAISLLAVVVLVFVLARSRAPRLRKTAYALILAGATGNLVDRIFYDGRVVDFIEMGYRGHTFPVYNVADMGVSIGASLLILGRDARFRTLEARADPPLPLRISTEWASARPRAATKSAVSMRRHGLQRGTRHRIK